MCLKCNACKNFCPSDIDARKIFLTAKAEYFQNCPEKKLISLFQSKFVFNSILNLVKVATSTYRFLKFDKILKNFYPILLKTGWLGKKIILANEFIGEGKKARRQEGKLLDKPDFLPSCPPALNSIPFESISKIVYFKGCVNEFINPRVKNSTEYILKQMGIEILPVKFECCGVPFLSCGNVEQFKKQAIFNISQIPDDFDYFLTDCASCQNTFVEYKNYIDDAQLLEKLEKINQKSINVVDFVLKNVKNIEFSEKTTFTFHKPCHLEDMSFLKEFLAKSKNIKYIEMKDFDKCCGFSGEFAIKNPEISSKISTTKAQNAIETKADYVLTSCPACILGLNQGLIEVKSKKQKAKRNLSPFTFHSSLNFIEFILMAKHLTVTNQEEQSPPEDYSYISATLNPVNSEH